MCESVHRKVCTRETQTDTMPGLAMLYINSSPNKQDGCGGKNRRALVERSDVISKIYHNSIILSLIIVENVDPVVSELSPENSLKIFQIK